MELVIEWQLIIKNMSSEVRRTYISSHILIYQLCDFRLFNLIVLISSSLRWNVMKIRSWHTGPLHKSSLPHDFASFTEHSHVHACICRWPLTALVLQRKSWIAVTENTRPAGLNITSYLLLQKRKSCQPLI